MMMTPPMEAFSVRNLISYGERLPVQQLLPERNGFSRLDSIGTRQHSKSPPQQRQRRLEQQQRQWDSLAMNGPSSPSARSTALWVVSNRIADASLKEQYDGEDNINKNEDKLQDSAIRSLKQNTTDVMEMNGQGDHSTSTNANTNNPDNHPYESASSKLRRLKDLMWMRETLEDLTAAEFACNVEAGIVVDEDRVENKKRRKRAVDYEKLLSRLNRRIRDMGCEMPRDFVDDKQTESTDAATVSPGTMSQDFSCILQSGVGMGSTVCRDTDRTALLERILRTRAMLLQVMQDHEMEVDDAESSLPFSIQLPDLSLPKVGSSDDDIDKKAPKLYVRDDGTVDWDGALQDQAALRKFGTAVWARINGRDPDSVDSTETAVGENRKDVVAAKIIETPQIKQARRRLHDLQSLLNEKESQHLALLNSNLRAGQAVANIRLASLEAEQRNKILVSASALELLKEKVMFQTLIYELERIYTYLCGELGNPSLKGYIPLQDRLNVAEFGLLAVQIDNLNRQLESDEVVDPDVLMVVMEQLTDFKRRLGIDFDVTGVTLDIEGIKRWTKVLLDKTKDGLAFYAKGIRLFWNDIVYCLRLFNRAAQGYTLQPREVRTLR